MTISKNFANQTFGGLAFSNIVATEADPIGTTQSFVASASTVLATTVPTAFGGDPGLRWSAFEFGATGPGSSASVAIEYDVKTLNGANGISGLRQAFTVDTRFGTGISIQAVESVYDLGANGVYDAGVDQLVGQISINLADTSTSPTDPNPGDFQLIGAYSGLHVTVTVTASVATIANGGSADGEVNISIISQGFRQAALANLARLGDYVFDDLDRDGVQDDGETGVAGVVVNLLDKNGNPTLLSTVTDANGFYLFDNLNAGTYSVEFEAPAAYAFSPQDSGGDDGADSDADVATGRSGPVTLAAGETNLTVDAGIYRDVVVPPASLGDYVFLDADADGVQDSGELGIEGVTVNLLTAGVDGAFGTGDEVVAGTTVTDADGKYGFAGLVPGSYAVQFVAPSGYFASPALKGGDAALDSNPDASGITAPVTLVGGQHDPSIDAGLYRLASLGDVVFNDLNNNGIQDDGEAGVAGVTVSLLNGDGTPTGLVDVTDTNGVYGFADLVPGSYTVQFDAPAGYVISPANQGGDDAKDSDANGAGRTGVVELSSGESDITVDAGLFKPLALGDYVFLDADADGVQDATEMGVAGVSVTLLDGSGKDTGLSQVTNKDGGYLFTGLTTGDYIVQFAPVAGYVFSKAGQGVDSALDSNADAGGTTGVISLGPDNDDLTIDAGIYQLASLGDFVFHDVDQDGVQDATEAGVGGVTVKLLDGAGNETGLTKVTGGDGFYSFTGLTPGDYKVQFVKPDGTLFTSALQGGDGAKDSDADTGNGISGLVTLASGDNNTTIDAGIYTPAPVLGSIGNFVWRDKDADGIQDKDEAGIAGVTVKLLDGKGVEIASQLTNGNGGYLFGGLAAGTYAVSFVKPAGNILSDALQGGDTALDSNPNSAGLTAPIVLAAGENNLTIDAGLYQLACIGDYVFCDTNMNGVQDSGEVGVSGVTVRLLDSTGAYTGVSTVTNGQGGYLFADLKPGTYAVQFVKPSTYTFSASDQGGNDAKDSDANATTGISAFVTVESGEFDNTIDAGLYKQAEAKGSIGNFVWCDLDADGIQDSGEGGFCGVTVKLLNSSGQVIATQTTNSQGGYLFSNLSAGDYKVQFVAPGGKFFSPSGQGSDPAKDSNAGSTGYTATISLDPGENDLTIDAGLYAKACIGDRVWKDTDRDGLQDCDEVGICGVTVKLLDAHGNYTGISTTTNSNGNYKFDNLTPGTYKVQFIAPSGYAFTSAFQGTDKFADSNADSTSGITSAITLRSGDCYVSIDAGMYCAPTFTQGFKGLTAGFWSTHKEAWDDNCANDSKWAHLVNSGVLRAKEILKSSGGVLLGDANGNGYKDYGENTLFVSLAGAQKIISSSTSTTDMRQVLMKQAIAAQLNVYNGDRNASNLVGEAVKWLTGASPFSFSDGSTGDVDTNNDGKADFASISAGTLAGSPLAASKMAWHLEKDVHDSSSVAVFASGEDLKNALMWFNEDQLVTNNTGSLVAWKSGGSFSNITNNTPDAFWTVLESRNLI